MTKVLIADDDLFYRGMISGWVKAMGYDVVLARNGIEAIDVYSKVYIDIVILDVFMDIMNGIEVLNKLSAYADMQAQKMVPVIVVTSDMSKNTETLIRKEKAAFFLLKPFSREFLTDVVREAVRAAG